MSVSDQELSVAASRVVRLLAPRSLTLALGESCTGGLIGSLITDVPGSSRCFLGGVVAYANQAKTALLDVPPETIEIHGSVSEATVLAMAHGVRNRFDSDIGVGVSGILGPDGGTEEKPVGLVYLAVVARDGHSLVRRAVWRGNRQENKRNSAFATLELIEEILNPTDN